MILSRESVKRLTYGKTLQKGELLYRNKAVRRIREREDGSILHISATVDGSYGMSYHTWIEVDLAQGEITEYECECPAYYQYDGMCKHCAALALHYIAPDAGIQELENFLNQNKGGGRKKAETDAQASRLIYDYSMDQKAGYLQPEINGRIELEPRLIHDYDGWKVDFRIGAEHKYVLKDIHSFLEAVDQREQVIYGKKLGFIHEPGAFTRESGKLLAFLQKCVGEYRYIRNGISSYYYQTAMRALPLSEGNRAAFFHLMAGKQIKLEDDYSQDTSLEILREDPLLSVRLEATGNGEAFLLQLPMLETCWGEGRLYVRQKDRVYECGEEYSRQMRRLCSLGNGMRGMSLTISARDMTAFCSTLLPVLQNCTELLIDGDISAFMPGECCIKIYLDCAEGFVTARLEAEYGDRAYNLLEPFSVSDAFRDTARESAAVRTAAAYFDGMTLENTLALEEKNEDQLYRLLTTGTDQLAQVGELYISEAFKRLKVVKAPKVSVGISLSEGLIDLQVDTGWLPKEELSGYLASYRRKKKYFRLKDGSFLELENNGLSVVSELAEGLDLDVAELRDGHASLPKYRGLYVNQVLKEEAEGTEVFRNQAFKSMIRDMKAVEDSDYEVPEELSGILRPYQKTGFRWLCTLAAMGFGGILADDMGLGKTIQMIAFLIYQKGQEKEHLPGLIVCPASLIYNWQSELEKFAGEALRAGVLAGSRSERCGLLEEYRAYDVLITSYDLLKRDMELYENLEFSVQILDEAQNIKNHTTQSAKAVKKVKAGVRFALTGTPVENRLSELWSIFDFLMPGFLGRYERFRKGYESPIVQNQDQDVILRLQRMIRPFILRRIKADVLKDLPEKEETVVYSRLEGEQRKLYEANVQKLLASLAEKSEEEVGSSKLQILADLTRLRQICCAPEMVYENYRGESSKLDTCMELLKNALEGGHKVLLFSQFTSLFGLLEKRLGKEKIPFYQLTGNTPKAKRMEMVRRFNDPESEIPLFLISLKAGGTGLNLTAADIVIHFDPWWNAAAQNQATDRAHRIGQKNTVSVFKLIARGTIEERIVKLQDTKKDLADQIISEGGISVSGLTKEDFMGLLEGAF